MIYAQIKNNTVVNTIVLTDTSLISLFSTGFDHFVQIDTLTPVPQIGWTYNGTSFVNPKPPLTQTNSTSGTSSS